MTIRTGTACGALCLLLALPWAASASHARTLKTFLPVISPVSVVVTKGTLPAVCSNARSPANQNASGSRWRTELSGANNIAPGTTGVPAPMPGPARGNYDLIVDEVGQTASWTLTLCDFPQYIASHLHSGSSIADYPPPLVPLEPYVKPANPFAPPTQLPQLCPALNIVGCAYTKSGSFSAGDITPLPGRYQETPGVASWTDFINALTAGKIYVNVHSLKMPAGLIRGNLAPVSAVDSSTGSQVNQPTQG